MKPERPKQETPAEMVNALLGVIRNGFYGDALDQFWKDQAFIKRNVILWPAAFINGKSFTMAPERYKEVLLEVFMEIKRHGQTEAVKFWPGYLMKCVQEHFRIHWDEYYEEAKAIRSKVDQALFAARRATETGQGPDTVAAMALTHSLMKKATKAKRKPAAGVQRELF